MAGILGIASGLISRAVTRTGYKAPMVLGRLLVAAGLLFLGHVRPEGTYLRDVLPRPS